MQAKKKKCEAIRQPDKNKSEALYIPKEKLTRNTTLVGQKVTET